MRVVISLFVFYITLATAFGQVTYNVMEFTGKVLAIEPGFQFVYESLDLEVDGAREHFAFYPEYGQLILSKVRVGDLITLKARVNQKNREDFKKLPAEKQKMAKLFNRSFITEIKFNKEWVELVEPAKSEKAHYLVKSFLEQKVEEVYTIDNTTRAFRIAGGVVAYSPWFMWSPNSLDAIKVGDVISFSGWQSIIKPGFQFPTENVSDLYSFHRLTKKVGNLKSYLYKQNYVCIGLKLDASRGEFAVSFPSDRAKEILSFVKPEKSAIFYFYDYKIEGLLDAPELHAIIQQEDTLYINRIGFYGGADVKHEYIMATVSGKIKEVVRSDRGRIISLLVNTDCYIEMDARFEKQIGNLLKRGATIEVQGDERIKKDGEMYSKDYRIIIPNQITIDGKVYTLNQLP